MKYVQTGATAEAYVYYRLLSWGYDVHFASGLMSPFDLWVNSKQGIIRIQVKGTAWPESNRTKRGDPCYKFSVGKTAGRGKKQKYDAADFDILAMVGLPHQACVFSTDFTNSIIKRTRCKKFDSDNEKKSWEKAIEKLI